MPPPQLWLRSLQAGSARGLSAQELAWGRDLQPAHRHRYWQSRSALRQLAAHCLGCSAAAVPLVSPPGSPPRLERGAGFVSLSHSGSMLLTAWSPRPIGVDLEAADRSLAAAALARRHYPAPEWRELQQLAPAALRLAVLRSWVLKEAAVKWRQRTLAGELGHWHYHHASGRLRHRRDDLAPPCCQGLRAGWIWAVVGAASACFTAWEEPPEDGKSIVNL